MTELYSEKEEELGLCPSQPGFIVYACYHYSIPCLVIFIIDFLFYFIFLNLAIGQVLMLKQATHFLLAFLGHPLG